MVILLKLLLLLFAEKFESEICVDSAIEHDTPVFSAKSGKIDLVCRIFSDICKLDKFYQ